MTRVTGWGLCQAVPAAAEIFHGTAIIQERSKVSSVLVPVQLDVITIQSRSNSICLLN
ncbi:MAG: hypothetical protein WCK86_00125 [Planctomycetia bacterium]